MRAGRILLAAFILALLSIVWALASKAYSEGFILQSYSVKPQAGSEVYPGSANVEIVVDTVYEAGQQAESVVACIQDTNVVVPSRGYTLCSPAYMPNGSLYGKIEPGSLVRFKFLVDVPRNVTPGSYILTITVKYYVVTVSGPEERQDEIQIAFNVSEYPKLEVAVVKSYMTPYPYPGSTVQLNIVLLNNGTSDITGGSLTIQLPTGFSPRTVETNLPPIPQGTMQTVTVQVSIDPDVSPGSYVGILHGVATAVTPDGVRYNSNFSAQFTIEVKEPPQNIVELVDRGLAMAPTASNAALTKAYIVLLVAKPDIEIYSVEASWSVSGATFANGSSRAVSFQTGVYRYGDYIVLYSPPLDRVSKSVNVRVELRLLAYSGGSSFWVKRSYWFTASLPEYKPGLRIVSVYWSQEPVYPGSNGLTLNVVVENDDILTIQSLTAILTFDSKSFLPQRVVATFPQPISPYSQAVLRFTGISILETAKPGTYPARLVIRGTAQLRDGSHYNFTIETTISVSISSHELTPLKLVELYIGPGIAYEGLSSASLHVVLEVNSGIRITSLYVKAMTPSCMEPLEKLAAQINTPLQGGEVLSLNLGKLYIAPTCENNVSIILVATGKAETPSGSTFKFTQVIVGYVTTTPPKANITVVSAELRPDIASAGYTAGASIALELASLTPYTVRNLILELCLHNATFLSGDRCKTVSLEQPLPYGGTASVEFKGVSLQSLGSNSIWAELRIIAVVDTGDGVYIAHSVSNLSARVVKEYKPLSVALVVTRYNGEPVPLLPGQHGVVIEVTLLNNAPYPVSSAALNFSLPYGFKLLGVSGTCLNGVAPGAACTLAATVDVDPSVRPGVYNASLMGIISFRVGSSVVEYRQEISFRIRVADAREYLPNPAVLAAYWGQTPSVAYQYSGINTLTILVFNPSRWPAHGVRVLLKPLNSSVAVLADEMYCAQTLAGGGVCRAQFSVDLSSARSGILYFNVTIAYIATTYGIHLNLSKTYTEKLTVNSFTASQGVALLNYGWLHGWHVYPDTENATFITVLANMNPYSIGGVRAELILPPGFKSEKGEDRVVAYVGGPIRSLSSFTIEFPLDVGDVKPGVYNATLIVRYLALVEGVSKSYVEVYNVSLEISDPTSDLTLAGVEWAGQIPQPDTKGALLIVHIRNDGYAIMRGVIVEVKLPKGVKCAINNESYAVLPIFTSFRQQSHTPSLTAKTLADMTRLLLQQPQLQQTIGPGEIFDIYIPLNLYLRKPIVFNVSITVNFIDQWGAVRKVNISVKVPPYGTASTIAVEAPKVVGFYNGVARMRLNITNEGSGPIYNVYVYIVPRTPLATVNTTVFYFSVIRPGTKASMPLEVYYSPASLRYFGGSVGEYSPIQLAIAVMYRDLAGFTHAFNTSISIVMKPFIDLRLGSDVKAELKAGLLYVGGTIENHGISKAHSVTVYLTVDDKTSSSFLGDLDAGSQTAFRVELANITIRPSKVNVTVVYRDDYGGIHKFTRLIPVTVAPVETEAQAATPQSSSRSYLIVAGAVTAFLAFAALLLYKFVRRHEKRLEKVEEA